MYSDDNQWALVDLKARDSAVLEHARNSGDALFQPLYAESYLLNLLINVIVEEGRERN